jgi:hypothetical protein
MPLVQAVGSPLKSQISNLKSIRAIDPNIIFGADFNTDLGKVRRIAAKPTVFKRGSVKG